MTSIDERAGLDVLYSDKTCTLTLNKLTVDKIMIKVVGKGIDKDHIVVMAARASRLENQNTIDTAIVSMLADPNEGCSFLLTAAVSSRWIYVNNEISVALSHYHLLCRKARAGIKEVDFLPFNPTDKRTALTYL